MTTGKASSSQVLILMWKFNCPDICCRGNTAGHKQSRGVLECIDDSFLTEVIEELTIGGYSTGPDSYKQGELVRHVKV